jgi:hypothetical protein
MASAVRIGHSFVDHKELAAHQASMICPTRAHPSIPDSGLCPLNPLHNLSIGLQFEAVRADAYLPNLDSELAWYRAAFETWK